jgi:hypothetical protein
MCPEMPTAFVRCFHLLAQVQHATDIHVNLTVTVEALQCLT